jgi:hypothetical protein
MFIYNNKINLILFTSIKRYMEKKELVNTFINKLHIIEKLAWLVGFHTCRRATLPYLSTLSFSFPPYLFLFFLFFTAVHLSVWASGIALHHPSILCCESKEQE